MRILVTGGAGFIGSALIRHIINHTNDIVLNVDKLTYAGNLASLESVSYSPRYFFKKLDICSAIEIEKLLAEFCPDAIMHLAAESHVDRSITDAADFIQTNIVGTYLLLEKARDYWGRLSADKAKAFRFHHVSTDEVGATGDKNSHFKPF